MVLCSGKVYYDLYEERQKRGIKDVYLMRLEQLYPFPHKVLASDLHRFPGADIVWCQEEPKNMGSWTFIRDRLEAVMGEIGHPQGQARYVGRTEAASPATGLMKKHLAEQAALVDEALSLPTKKSARRPVATKAPARKPATKTATKSAKSAAKPAAKRTASGTRSRKS